MAVGSNIIKFPYSVSRKAHARKQGAPKNGTLKRAGIVKLTAVRKNKANLTQPGRKEYPSQCELERNVFARLLQHFDPEAYAIAVEEIAKRRGA